MIHFRRAPLLSLTLALALAGCGQTQADTRKVVEREILDLITALTPPSPTSIPIEKSQFFATRKRTLERLRAASEAHGLEALRVYREDRPDLPEVRSGLLDIAAHTAPAASEELLVQLVSTFGEDLYVRRAATELLGDCLPQRALSVLEPILRERYDDRTYPPEELMLEAWVRACEKLSKDPVPLLALIATDLQRPQEVRHLATRALGRHDTPFSRQALETLLVESSGNGYIRRLALQSLENLLPKEGYCELVKRIQSREADTDFIVFLESALDKSCR